MSPDEPLNCTPLRVLVLSLVICLLVTTFIFSRRHDAPSSPNTGMEAKPTEDSARARETYGRVP